MDWKIAKVTPICKSGFKDDMNNYRPISVISPIAKVFERIIYNNSMSFYRKIIYCLNTNQGSRNSTPL